MNIPFGKPSCHENSCGIAAVISFAGRDFCLGHFVTRCYERLDGLEPLVRNRSFEPGQIPAIWSLLEECAHRALLVSLRHEPLTNLDRSRLLEILLHCGDLQWMLRNLSFPKHGL